MISATYSLMSVHFAVGVLHYRDAQLHDMKKEKNKNRDNPLRPPTKYRQLLSHPALFRPSFLLYYEQRKAPAIFPSKPRPPHLYIKTHFFA
jgi:hypothetical protein